MTIVDPGNVTGVILAGGLATRMQNKDKGLVHYKGKPLVSYAAAAMGPLADVILISANRNIEVYQQFGWPVISDETAGFDGPLAGIASAMRRAESEFLIITPCDSPLIKTTHLQRLLLACNKSCVDCAVASDGHRLHPVFLVLKRQLADSLTLYLESGERKVQLWLAMQRMAIVNFNDTSEIFSNINTLTDLDALEAIT